MKRLFPILLTLILLSLPLVACTDKENADGDPTKTGQTETEQTETLENTETFENTKEPENAETGDAIQPYPNETGGSSGNGDTGSQTPTGGENTPPSSSTNNSVDIGEMPFENGNDDTPTQGTTTTTTKKPTTTTSKPSTSTSKPTTSTSSGLPSGIELPPIMF